MRRILGSWVAVLSCCVIALGTRADDGPRLGPIAEPLAGPSLGVELEAPLIEGGVDGCPSESVAPCGHPHPCHRRCEAGRFRSYVPRGHCQAICESLREIACVTADVPYSFYEWARKIKNTLLDRGTCRDGACAPAPACAAF